MFQSFPLHDRSSVNLRGEYHAENVTTFEETPANGEDTPDKMEVDADSEADKAKDEKDSKSATKAVSFDAKNKPVPDKPIDMSALYPVFWSLQHFFSQPLTLFDGAQFTKFKKGMDATMSAFETVDKLQKTSKTTDETKIVPQKRKIPEGAEERDGSNYNPKYLTSRDLFELEVLPWIPSCFIGILTYGIDKRFIFQAPYSHTSPDYHRVPIVLDSPGQS